ncbi:MAG: AAA family ATPase [Deltaproteobacteria bacterium]|nr:AAA family ATPase [Deltaproteobacteria bacterium]
MYNNYFGFSDSPFENNLDQRFLFFSANHKEVTAALHYFIKWKKGFALVCGDVGTGKTMLINYLLNKLPDSVHPIMIANPDVGYIEILRYVAGILKIDAKGKRALDLVDHVKAALVEASRTGERFVLIIDEAHLLSDKSIEQIRLLSNIETQEHKLFQILLLGQYELSYKLSRPELRQLRQRININRFLAPMDATETIQYIDHRLKMAGASFDACFEPNCRHLIFKMTNGVPRSINQICDSALLVCKAEKLQKVNKKALKKAGTALRSDILYTPRYHEGSIALSWKTMKRSAAFGAFAILLILIGISGYQWRLGQRTEYLLNSLFPSVLTPLATVRENISETTANPGMPPATIKPFSIHSEDFRATAINKETISHSPEIEIQSSVQQTPEKKDPESNSGMALPEMEPTMQIEALASSLKRTSNIDPPPPSSAKDFQPENQATLLHNSKKITVKKGDTLNGIASRFFPENIADGVKIILAANPVVDDMDRIYAGQELIIPETDFYRKDLN